VIELDFENTQTTINNEFNAQIITISKGFDLSGQVNNNDKFQFMFNCAIKALEEIFESLNISLSLLTETIEKIKEKGFELCVNLCKTPIFNKHKNIQAQLLAEYQIEYVTIILIFYIDDRSIKRINLFKTFPHYFIYDQLISKLRWIDNQSIEISNNSGEFSVRIGLDGRITPIYKPKDRDIDGVIEEIRFLSKEVFFKL
jgi:hypothetical protein